jgi:fructose-1,6-bisphosphatase/inositol monophosphatase family enzyme
MASALVLKEAGGQLCDLRGKPIIDDDVKATGISMIGTKNNDLNERIVRTLAIH